MNDRAALMMARIQSALTPDLLRPEWRGRAHPHAGHCYAASEALYHALGGREAGYRPCVARCEGGAHWFLRDRFGDVLDPTAGQFPYGVRMELYACARGCGFLTRAPSKRARTILARCGITTESTDER